MNRDLRYTLHAVLLRKQCGLLIFDRGFAKVGCDPKHAFITKYIQGLQDKYGVFPELGIPIQEKERWVWEHADGGIVDLFIGSAEEYEAHFYEYPAQRWCTRKIRQLESEIRRPRKIYRRYHIMKAGLKIFWEDAKYDGTMKRVKELGKQKWGREKPARKARTARRKDLKRLEKPTDQNGRS